jgi:hypothetical protein
MKNTARPVPPRRPRRPSSARMLLTVTATTAMVATGGFGVFPDNPLSQTFQQVISQNVSADFLQPFNSFMEIISAPTMAIMPKTDRDQGPDIFDSIPSIKTSPPTPMPATSAVVTPTPSETSIVTQTEMPTPTTSSTPTLTPFSTSTLTPTPSTTPTYLPLWTKTKKPIQEEESTPNLSQTPIG